MFLFLTGNPAGRDGRGSPCLTHTLRTDSESISGWRQHFWLPTSGWRSAWGCKMSIDVVSKLVKFRHLEGTRTVSDASYPSWMGCGGQESIFDGYLLVILNFHEVTYSYGSTPGPCRAGGVCCALSCGVWCSRDAVLEIWVNLFDVISPGVKSCFEVSKTCSWTLGKEKRFTSLWTWWPVDLMTILCRVDESTSRVFAPGL